MMGLKFLTIRVNETLYDGVCLTKVSLCLTTTFSVPLSRGSFKLTKKVKFTVPPDRGVIDFEAYLVP